MDFIDFEDILDRDYGPVGTPKRDEFERRVEKEVKFYQDLQLKKKDPGTTVS